jgi:hypothetical protein
LQDGGKAKIIKQIRKYYAHAGCIWVVVCIVLQLLQHLIMRGIMLDMTMLWNGWSSVVLAINGGDCHFCGPIFHVQKCGNHML